MSNVSIKSVSNGFVVTAYSANLTPPTPGTAPSGPTEYVFTTWAEITTFLTDQDFIPQAQ